MAASFMTTRQFEVEVGWGKIAGQLFSSSSGDLAKSQPILALHGFLDNSNSMNLMLTYYFVKN